MIIVILSLFWQSLMPTFTVPLALALFERVRLSYATDIPSKKLSPEVNNFKYILIIIHVLDFREF